MATIWSTCGSWEYCKKSLFYWGRKAKLILMGVKKSIFLFALLFSFPLAAQKITGTIRGTVTDPSGAVVAGAQVTITNVNTAASRTANTGAEGFYAFTDLQPGVYNVKITHPKFRESVTT